MWHATSGVKTHTISSKFLDRLTLGARSISVADCLLGFRPDRWLDLPAAAKNGIGIVSGLMSFSVGPHVSGVALFLGVDG